MNTLDRKKENVKGRIKKKRVLREKVDGSHNRPVNQH